MFSSCPFCHITVPLSKLEWHANNHLVEEELARDMELAQQIALAPSSPRLMDQPMDYAKSSAVFTGRVPETSNSRLNCNSSDQRETIDQENISCLVGLQIKSTFYKVNGGLMALLRRCLESESGNPRIVISSSVDHYQSIASEDSGWGCGWRNIQMLSSHLLMQRQEAREVMFGSSGFVPDILSLQRWLEIAWQRGFDSHGSDSFNHKVYGSKKWVGTTECATLFRSFGLRARVVDFDSKSAETRSLSMSNGNLSTQGMQLNGGPRGKKIVEHVYGPMDKFLHGHDKSKQYTRKTNEHHVLVDWVWNYFTSDSVPCGRFDDSHHVLVSEKTPLYFQHDGHSRTIVGIQMQKGLHGLQDRCFLLVLDPVQRTTVLERSLRENIGWQKLIKRGEHTLKEPQYQLCYIDPGIAHKEEMEQLKTIDSVLVKF